MTTDHHTFSFSGIELRVVLLSSVSYFIAADVIKTIYGPTNNNTMPYSLLSEDERTYINRVDVGLKRSPDGGDH